MSEQDNEFLDLSGICPPWQQADSLGEKNFPILEGMSAINLRILNGASRMMHVSRGVEMLHEGNTPHDLYFVYKGKLSIGRRFGGKLRILAHLHPGDVYGEFGALRGKSRHASVFTAESSRIICVDAIAVQQVLDADSDFRNRLTQLLVRRILNSFFFSHPVFRKLPEDARVALVQQLPTCFAKRGKRIFSQGGTPKGTFIILSGEVEIRHLSQDRNEVLLEIRRDNDMFGELARDHGKSLAYSAVAASDVDMLKLDKDVMHTFKIHHPAIFELLQVFMDKRANYTIQRMKENLF